MKATAPCHRVEADKLALVEGTRALIVPFGASLRTGPEFGCNQYQKTERFTV